MAEAGFTAADGRAYGCVQYPFDGPDCHGVGTCLKAVTGIDTFWVRLKLFLLIMRKTNLLELVPRVENVVEDI